MHTSELLKHIYDINLSYLLLAQRLIVQDKASAMFRLGINEEMANTLGATILGDGSVALIVDVTALQGLNREQRMAITAA